MKERPIDPRLGMRMELSKPTPLGPESLRQFWNPGLFGIKLAPEDFREKLHAIDKGLEVTWNREIERWQVFFRSERAKHPLCRGWVLLFVVQDPSGAYLPLDARTLAKCFEVSGYRWRDGRQYWDSVVREEEREKEKREARDKDEEMYKAGEYWDYAYKTKTGYGPISASKVVGQ